MDNRIGEIETFLQVAERGSFAAAARALGQTPSAVSRTVARLEARLGLRLLLRTTRALALTAEGEAYAARAGALLADLDEMERSLVSASAEPRGRLRVNTSIPFGTHCVVPLLPTFLRQHPKVTVDLTLSETVIDLLEERADIAIRSGPLRDSALRARFLGQTRVVVVAAPAYLERRGWPRHPAELERHDCLTFNFRRHADAWPFRVDGTVERVTPRGPLLGNTGEMLRQAAVLGLGIVRLGRFHVEPDIAAGRLVPLLEEFDVEEREDFHALYVGHEHLSLRIRAFVDFLAASLRIDS